MKGQKQMKKVIAIACVALGLAAVAAPKVTIDKIENTSVWSTKKVTYTVSDVPDKKVGEYWYTLAFDVTAYGVTKMVEKGQAQNGTFTETLDTAAIFGETRKDPKAKIRVSVESNPPELQLWEGGPIFAECNVGANAPHESGYYFWWGDTVGYKRNANDDGWVSAKDGTTPIHFSACAPANSTFDDDEDELKSRGYIDDVANPVLNAAHDAATAYLGAPWRMMTKAELDKLVDETVCERTWTNNWEGTGKNGYVVKGKGAYAANSVFFPAVGCGVAADLGSSGSIGYYWSSAQSSILHTSSLNFDSSKFNADSTHIRFWGMPVRAVRGFAE